ncbi:DUF222 domain-containing protein [Nocardioides sp. HDW12B]|uniref:HNH endonuclease signature motif containing protein n=1 Tax=Nocardioides sp. HDW12B TaxID=2714939 RepID=UPI00140B9A12|nr:HNH endonuclease signature motif containing protein [Nocardioides sp. HDW12B]QIK65663.1 DUF222 domain-containing protein [Nocardioides sp. HDW12B]
MEPFTHAAADDGSASISAGGDAASGAGVDADAVAVAGADAGVWPLEGRWRGFSSVEVRTQRVHRFTGRLVAAVADATAGGVDGVAVGCLSAAEAGEAVLELGEVMARLKGLQLALLARADEQDVSTCADGGPAAVNTAAWLSHRGLVAGRVARGEVRRCRELTGQYAATGSALLAGDLDVAQAEVIVSSLNRLPGDLEVEDRVRAEKVMLAEAARLDAEQLRVVGRRLLEVIAPEVAEEVEAARLAKEEDAAAARTWLTTWDDGEGTTHLNVKLSTRHADMLRAALHAIANPGLADAICRTESSPSPKPGPRILGEAFCRLLETLDVDRVPQNGGMSATVVVTIPLATLHGGLEAATLDTGTRLSPGEARRMACDAGLVPVVLGGRSEVLDHGRARRLYSRSQRLAMAVRQDFRCAAEGCDRPSGWCDAHHLRPWSTGGRTDLADGVLLCGRHHTLVHHPDYTVRRGSGWRLSIVRTPRDTPRRQ